MPSDYDISITMIKYGGGFVTRLGAAWQWADASNQAKLKAAFPEYWEQYAELAELKAKQDAIDAR